MNPKKAKENARKRFGYLLSSNKGNDKGEFSKIKWDMHKEFNINFHDKTTCEHEIILNPDTFQGIQELEFIEIISATNSDIKLLFKLKKCNLDKIKSSISMLSVFSELIKNQNENLKLSTVYVRPANVSDYFVDKITLLFKEQFLSRKDVFQITQSMIDNTVYPNKDVKFNSIPESDEMNVGTIASFKGTKMRMPLTGLVTSSTDFQLRSLSSGLYFLVEISKDTYDFSFSSKTKFELIIEFLKQTLQKLKQTECSHVINVIFFTRIYFKDNRIKKLLKKKIEYNPNGQSISDYIYKSSIFPKEHFFDIYSKIIKVNINKLDKLDMVNMLHKGFEAYASIFKTNNLSEFITEIRKNYDTNLCKNHSSGNLINSLNPHDSSNYSQPNTELNPKINNNNSSSENHNLFFNNFFCPKFFEDIDTFRMTTSNTSNLFESINLIINDLNFEKKKMYKLGNFITVISSGEYFPYYNYRLSKLTKEGLFEHGIPFCMVVISNHTKAKEIYNEYALHSENDNEREFHTSWSNDNLFKIEEKIERGLSLSVKGNPMKDEDNLKMIIAKNYGIMDNLNANKICFTNRKNSSDNILIKDNNFVSFYKYESDIFNHQAPKWMKIFFINSTSLTDSSILKLNSFMNGSNNPNDNWCNLSFSIRNRVNSSDREGGERIERDREFNSKIRERSESKKFQYNILNCDVIENEIFNAKKQEIFQDEHIFPKGSDKIELEYLNLAGFSSEFKIKNRKRRNVTSESAINGDMSGNDTQVNNSSSNSIRHSENYKNNSEKTYSARNSSLLMNHNNKNITLKDIIQISSIYKEKYRDIKTQKNEDLNTYSSVGLNTNLNLNLKNSPTEDDQNILIGNSQLSTKTLISPTTNHASNLNLLPNTEEYKELKKRGAEYDHEVFNLKNFSKTSKRASEIENAPCSSICKRNLVLAFEFSETDDDFIKLCELLSQIPLLPIFGDFDTHAIKDDVGLNIHSVTTPLNSDINILEEIIFERINNNYQIVRNTSLADNYNKPLDLKNIDSILLFDRRFYHIISTDELNYKVRIYNYSNKLNKYFSASNNLTINKNNEQILNRSSFIYDNDFNLEYNYFIYDFRVKLLSGKKLTSTLGEKNNIYWYKYDHLLNEIQSNISSIKFKNELHFLFIDKLQRYSQRKMKFYFKSKILYRFHHLLILDNSNFANKEEFDITKTHSGKFLNVSGDINILSNPMETNNAGRVNSNSSLPDGNANYFYSTSEFPGEMDISSFKERVLNFHTNVEFYLSKYSKLTEKLSEKINYVNTSDGIKNNNLFYNFIMLNNPINWILLVENEFFNEKNPLYFSFRWLSCNSIPIYNFYKELIKKSKLKDILLVKIPCDDIIYSNFRRICIWNFPYVNKANILDKILSSCLLLNFLRVEFENNYIYYSEENNMLIKISQKGCVYLLDEVLDGSDHISTPTPSLFLEYSTKLDKILDLFDFMNIITEKVEKLVVSNYSANINCNANKS